MGVDVDADVEVDVDKDDVVVAEVVVAADTAGLPS